MESGAVGLDSLMDVVVKDRSHRTDVLSQPFMIPLSGPYSSFNNNEQLFVEENLHADKSIVGRYLGA